MNSWLLTYREYKIMYNNPYNNYITSAVVFFTTNKLVELHGKYTYMYE